MVFLRLTIAVQLQTNWAVLQHFGLVGEIKDFAAIGGKPNSVADHQDFDLIPFAFLFQDPAFTAGHNAIAPMSIPDTPVMAEHQQWPAKAKLVFAGIRKLFSQRCDCRVHRGMSITHRLPYFQQESELPVLLRCEQIGAADNLIFVGASDHSILYRPVCFIACPSCQITSVK